MCYKGASTDSFENHHFNTKRQIQLRQNCGTFCRAVGWLCLTVCNQVQTCHRLLAKVRCEGVLEGITQVGWQAEEESLSHEDGFHTKAITFASSVVTCALLYAACGKEAHSLFSQERSLRVMEGGCFVILGCGTKGGKALNWNGDQPWWLDSLCWQQCVL